ncbi:MAG TPA: ABC transporter ATP-binding protein [Candidatus Binatia bacterium]|nr:ABC transporter ATP-binding protein [Candidatus Binatia bacterium]
MSQIEIRSLSKSYDGGGSESVAVVDLSLAVAAGEFVTLLGPSGCGKTTTLRLIAGYLTPDAGTISVSGRVLSSTKGVVTPEERGMGMVFQNYAVWPHKTVYENVVFGLRVRKIGAVDARERVARLLELVNLSGLESRYPSELSGGQQQRVALARSLVVEPAILLLDEPLSNLDAKLREHMRTELKALQRRTGITFIYVTHDQSEALALSDRIAVMDRGRLQQYGTPREVYRRPANRIVADFMGLVNLVPARVREAEGGRGAVEAGPLQLAIALPAIARAGDRVDLAIRPESIRLTVPGGASAEAMRARIVEQSYLGNMNEYVVAVGDLRLRVQAGPEAEFAPGSEALMSVDAEQCNVFMADDDESRLGE